MGNATEYGMKYATDSEEFQQFLKTTGKAQSKDEYLAWVAEWKRLYRQLSGDISAVKGMRKQKSYQYRDPKDNTVKRRTVVSENPNYDHYAWGVANVMSSYANQMLRARDDAKAASWARKQAAEREEAA